MQARAGTPLLNGDITRLACGAALMSGCPTHVPSCGMCAPLHTLQTSV